MSLDGDDHHIDMNFYQNFMEYEFDLVINENNHTLNNQKILLPQRDMTYLESYKSVKINIIHIVKDNSSITKLNEIVEKLHILRMLTTLILKLFILCKKYQSNKPLNIKRIVNEFFIVILIESIAANKTETVGKRSGRESKRPKYLDVYTNDYNDDCSSSDEMDSEVLRKQLLAFINDVVLEEDVDEENGLSQDIKELIVIGIDLRGLQNSIRGIAQSRNSNIIRTEHYSTL
jgi:hypothetical protein